VGLNTFFHRVAVKAAVNPTAGVPLTGRLSSQSGPILLLQPKVLVVTD